MWFAAETSGIIVPINSHPASGPDSTSELIDPMIATSAEAVPTSTTTAITYGLFSLAQARVPPPSAPSASAWRGITTSNPAVHHAPGMESTKLFQNASTASSLRARRRPPSAYISTSEADVNTTETATTFVLGAERAAVTELRDALRLRTTAARTPLNADGWHHHLSDTGLLCKYPSLVHHIRFGFPLGDFSILSTFTPNNHASIEQFHDVFDKNMQHELDTGRWLGPYSASVITQVLGPFQTSPMSIIPKPNKPGAYRFIQNLSYPQRPFREVTSINSRLAIADWPCSWGTFFATALLISSLPPDSEAAIRDVKEAFRSCPIRTEDWAKIVVRVGEDAFCADTCGMFGGRTSGGIHGCVADAGADIMRARGIGPIILWVDDHKFIRILRQHLRLWNERRARTCARIEAAGGRHTQGGRSWYSGEALPDDRIEEFTEDHRSPIRDLSADSPRSIHDAKFTYNMDDINRLSTDLGIIWDPSKDVSFCLAVPFCGFLWDLRARTVCLLDKKCAKYILAINTWNSVAKHTLSEAQSLHGKLMHAATVFPAGRAYLTGLAALIGQFGGNIYALRHSSGHIRDDLIWWKARLSAGSTPRRLPIPTTVRDSHAFSDASSGVGIGVWIGGWWRAWWLKPGWNSNGRDIGWAEAVGFELLTRIIIAQRTSNRGEHLKVWGDNRSVVEGWWKGSSHGNAINVVFKRIHYSLERADVTVHTRYVRSADNPADEPSRGHLGPRCKLLPPVDLGRDLAPFLDNCIDALGNLVPAPVRQPLDKLINSDERERRADLNAQIERDNIDLVEYALAGDL